MCIFPMSPPCKPQHYIWTMKACNYQGTLYVPDYVMSSISTIRLFNVWCCQECHTCCGSIALKIHDTAFVRKASKWSCLLVWGSDKRICEICMYKWSAHTQNYHEPPAGLEPAIPGLGGRCLIHWATEATGFVVHFSQFLSRDTFSALSAWGSYVTSRVASVEAWMPIYILMDELTDRNGRTPPKVTSIARPRGFTISNIGWHALMKVNLT